MTHPYFFGYGSLVNTETHHYVGSRPAVLRGWRRAWVQIDCRDMAFLTAVPHPGAAIQGLIAVVPNADWQALDQRETGYDRLPAQGLIEHDLLQTPDLQVYAIARETQNQIEPAFPILMSYLDVVVQGYLRVFGQAGVQAFFDTTDGWDRTIIDDRAHPRYPRHQILSQAERALVNHHLAQTAARIVPA